MWLILEGRHEGGPFCLPRPLGRDKRKNRRNYNPSTSLIPWWRLFNVERAGQITLDQGHSNSPGPNRPFYANSAIWVCHPTNRGFPIKTRAKTSEKDRYDSINLLMIKPLCHFY